MASANRRHAQRRGKDRHGEADEQAVPQSLLIILLLEEFQVIRKGECIGRGVLKALDKKLRKRIDNKDQ